MTSANSLNALLKKIEGFPSSPFPIPLSRILRGFKRGWYFTREKQEIVIFKHYKKAGITSPRVVFSKQKNVFSPTYISSELGSIEGEQNVRLFLFLTLNLN